MAISKATSDSSSGGPAEENKSSTSLFGRRDFLTQAGLACFSGALLAGTGLSLRTFWPRTGEARSLLIPAGRLEEYAVGQINQKLVRDHLVWVLRTPEGFWAFSAICTHLGCKLRYVAGPSPFRCMCHGSIFSENGEVLQGPAARPLERVFITLNSDGQLWVNPDVRYRKERGEWEQPGALVRYPREKKTG